MISIIDLPSFWQRPKYPPQVTIAIWGAAQAGKTAFIAALESAARFEGLAIFAADVQTEKTMNILRAQRSAHQFPVATPMPTTLQELSFLRFGLKSTKRNLAISLTIVDASGKWWTTTEEGKNSSNVFSPYFSILKKCDGLICLIDPTEALTRPQLSELAKHSTGITSASVALQTMLAQLRRTTMSDHDSLKTKIAICLSQMDRPEHYGHLGREEAYFKRLYGAIPIHNWVAQKSWKFFGCSAAGVLQRAGYVISNTYKEQEGQALILDPTVPPLHLFRPIKWILELA